MMCHSPLYYVDITVSLLLVTLHLYLMIIVTELLRVLANNARLLATSGGINEEIILIQGEIPVCPIQHGSDVISVFRRS